MLLDTTYFSKENKELILELVGRPIPFFQKIRMGGIGSKRLMIKEVSQDFQNLVNRVSDINYANIEIRPAGILVMINKGLKNFTWVIPFYQLSFYNTSNVSIHAQGKFIRFRRNKNHTENKKFFQKMMDQKIEFEKDSRIDGAYDYHLTR